MEGAPNPQPDSEPNALKRPLEATVEEAPAKRARGETASKVIYLRGLPPGTTDAEIFEVCGPFGTLVNILKMPARNHAFVEFDLIEQATAFLAAYQYHGGCVLRGQVCPRGMASGGPARALWLCTEKKSVRSRTFSAKRKCGAVPRSRGLWAVVSRLLQPGAQRTGHVPGGVLGGGGGSRI